MFNNEQYGQSPMNNEGQRSNSYGGSMGERFRNGMQAMRGFASQYGENRMPGMSNIMNAAVAARDGNKEEFRKQLLKAGMKRAGKIASQNGAASTAQQGNANGQQPSSGHSVLHSILGATAAAHKGDKEAFHNHLLNVGIHKIASKVGGKHGEVVKQALSLAAGHGSAKELKKHLLTEGLKGVTGVLAKHGGKKGQAVAQAITGAAASGGGFKAIQKSLINTGIKGATQAGVDAATGLLTEFAGPEVGMVANKLLGKAGSALDKVVGKYAVKGAEKLEKLGVKEAKKLGKGAIKEAKKLGKGAVKEVKKIGSKAKKIGKGAVKEAKKIGHSVANAANSVGNKVKHFFHSWGELLKSTSSI